MHRANGYASFAGACLPPSWADQHEDPVDRQHSGRGAVRRGNEDVATCRLNNMPDGESLCHGDFHPRNLLGSVTGAIDWLDACQGDAAADVCRSYLLLRLYAPQLTAPYLHAYTRHGGTTGNRVSRWLPFIAAARLAEGVTSETERLLEMVLGG